MRRLFLTALATLGLDQLSKWWVLGPLALDMRGHLDVAPPWLSFRMAWNEGINFGLLGNLDARWTLSGLALAICALVLWWVIRDRAGRWEMLSAGLLIGGAIGNVIDRIRFGAVADFLNMSCCGIHNPYAFNVADVAIFLGAVGLIMFSGGTARKRA